MRNIISIISIMLLLSSCNYKNDDNKKTINNSNTVTVRVTEKMPWMKDCKKILDVGDFKCKTDDSEIFVSEKIPGLNCEKSLNTLFECSIIKK